MSYLPLRTINWIVQLFENELEKYNVEEYTINKFEKVLLINDSLALYVKIYSGKVLEIIDEKKKLKFAENPYLDVVEHGSEYYSLKIEEVTYNELGFKHNHTKFVNDLCLKMNLFYLNQNAPDIAQTSITYTKFKGYTRLYWCPDVPTTAEYVEKILPQLKLRERYNLWQGLKYNFILFEVTDKDNKIHRAVSYTVQRPDKYIEDFIYSYLTTGHIVSTARTNHTSFNNALNTYKGKLRKENIEKNLQYCIIEKYFREKDDVWRYADKILENANNGKYDDYEKNNYLKPAKNWVIEEWIYKEVKKNYKEYAVIYQYKPFFLKSSEGKQLSYDVFISKLNIGLVYRGKQYFKPLKSFGGIDAFNKLQQLDKEKAELSRKNGVKLIYLNYGENVTIQMIQRRINEYH